MPSVEFRGAKDYHLAFRLLEVGVGFCSAQVALFTSFFVQVPFVGLQEISHA